MKLTPTTIPEVLVVEPKLFGDARGFFFESYRKSTFDDAVGRDVRFVQDNHSRSTRGVLRGIHYQLHKPQGKLVRVVRGEVFDVAVDLRRGSATFGRWVGELLSEENQRQLWVPEGFGHAFVVLSESADFVYKTTDYYAPEHERCIRWDDPTLAIDWPKNVVPSLSPKDAAGRAFADAETYP